MELKRSEAMSFHPNYGEEIGEGAIFCSYCGTKLSKGEKLCSSCGRRIGQMGPENATEAKYPHQLATVLGYIFGFLGGLLGIAFDIYLLTGEHQRAKYHGKAVLIIGVFMTIFWISLDVALT